MATRKMTSYEIDAQERLSGVLAGIDIGGLYRTYGKTSDEEIRELLKRILLVKRSHKGVGSRYGYYALGDKVMKDILKNPRDVSHTFGAGSVGKLVSGLREFKRIPFLVKSSSRFFLKADIGEVFDAMSDKDKKQTKAIETLTDSVTLNSPGYDHFLCTAILLK